MRNVEIVGVDVVGKEVVVSLFGGTTNVVGTIRFWESDEIKLHELRRRAEALMNSNVLVDLALSLSMGRWRLIGKNREILGGMEPTRLMINQSKSQGWNKGGLSWPEGWAEEE